MAKVRLSAEVEPELGRLVEIAAASSGQSVSEWVEAAVWTSLERKVQGIHLSRPGAKPKGTVNPPRLRDGGSLSDTVIEDREERDRSLASQFTGNRDTGDASVPPGMHLPSPSVKPQGITDAPTLREGSATVAGAVSEDRDSDDIWPSDIQRGRPRTKPRGLENPPRLADGSLLSDIVIEDRR